MARNIQNINDLLRFIIRKERGAWISAPESDESLDAGQLDTFEEYFKVYGETQTIHDALRPFRVYYNFTSDSSGNVTFPADYLHVLPNIFTVQGSTRVKVTMVNEDEWVDATNSQLREPTLLYPIGRDTATGFVLFPFSLQTGFFTYLRRPATPVYAYTQTGRVITYNAAGSTQLEWTDIYINNIIAKALKYFGIDLDEDKIIAYAENMDKETI